MAQKCKFQINSCLTPGNGMLPHLKNTGLDYGGAWERGFMHGKGTLRFPNGDVYSREFQNDKQKGEGRMYFSNGDLYIGSWQGGQVHGFGTFHYYNGGKFEGRFDMGKRHGKGARQNVEGAVVVIHKYANGQRWVMESISRLSGRKAWKSKDGKRKGQTTPRQARDIIAQCEKE